MGPNDDYKKGYLSNFTRVQSAIRDLEKEVYFLQSDRDLHNSRLNILEGVFKEIQGGIKELQSEKDFLYQQLDDIQKSVERFNSFISDHLHKVEPVFNVSHFCKLLISNQIKNFRKECRTDSVITHILNCSFTEYITLIHVLKREGYLD